ncbi:MAG: DEAD/DEAH box helicase, partial [Alphaproteobacteria bacterium]
MNFFDLGLSKELQDVITGLGYIKPTPIQQQAIPQILCGRDVFGCAQTGTGKTASFLLPMIDILKQESTKSRMPRAIILEPTRELAAQVYENFQQLSAGTTLTGVLLVGG